MEMIERKDGIIYLVEIQSANGNHKRYIKIGEYTEEEKPKKRKKKKPEDK